MRRRGITRRAAPLARACAAISLATVLAVSSTAAATPLDDGASTGGEITDPALLDELAVAAPGDRVVVELLTDDVAGARAAARALGGVVTGTVPGEVVQVSIAASGSTSSPRPTTPMGCAGR